VLDEVLRAVEEMEIMVEQETSAGRCTLNPKP
jgi:hypothetical protein